ncbi:unnamed protein product [Adineta ricciae]|uniref:TRAM domain-containing protein n=1 Tax=Adineta ricciae TaxID=249248 RepID=A0A813XPC0_ADIRI|nr:unnamed protein product [Adineta ricciae]CAF0872793.1 unnamed protein product [Adineta ricciae]
MVGKTSCAVCSKSNGVWKCQGCSQAFCSEHVNYHQQELAEQMDVVENERNLILQILTEHTATFEKDAMIERINQWERTSIETIRREATDARLMVSKHAIERIDELKSRLQKLTEDLRINRNENNFHETDLYRWKADLTQLKNDVQSKLIKMKISKDSTPLVYKIILEPTVPEISKSELPSSPVGNYKRWSRNGITIAGEQESGCRITQFCNPVRICMDDNNQTLYIVDHWNNRIMKWKSNAMCDINSDQRLDQLNRPGDIIIDELNDSLIISDVGNRRIVQWPRHQNEPIKVIISDIVCQGLAMDNCGNLYVSDYERHEVRRWQIGDVRGVLVAGGNKRGSGLNQLDSPTGIFVDHEQSVYIADYFNHRVMKWKEGSQEGTIVAGSQTEGNGLAQLSGPNSILVDQSDTIYIADTNNHRVMRWLKNASQGTVVVGGHGHGGQSNQLYNPRGLLMDRENNLYVADSSNHRIQKYRIESS